ncbi:phage scaffolding protein [Paenibacillus sinopodophylli]|uniref:phage scaffolding protein n=1 Tax=Paenibacillus sinopodophylli TaxID=1837342 RepID=UPI00110D003F|nr:phage scaffolding protein [Paenibacillus sinopodophylli]
MNKEQFIALGLTEDLAEKAAAASGDELKGFVPKARFDEVNTSKKTAEDTLKERDKQLDELSKTAGASEELKAQITKLQGENTAAKEQYESDLKELTLTNAIKSALTGKVHDEALATGLFDRSKLVIDGDKVVGLDEQLKGLQESKAFLFKTEDPNQQQQQKPGFQVGGGGNPTPPATTTSLKDALTAHFQAK